MSMRTSEHVEELAKARLAYVSLGQRSLTAPRRALTEPQEAVVEQTDEEPPDDAPSPRHGWRQRLALHRQHLAAVAVLLVVGLLWLGWQWSRSQASETVATAVETSSAPQESAATESTSAPAPSPASEPARVRVHVLGAVAAPGVVTLDDGAIVADALEAAGGLTAEARPGDLNLAMPVADGLQIKVGSDEEDSAVNGSSSSGGAPKAAGAGEGRLDLNTATAGELETLPGIGPVTAAAIVAWRDEHGQFRAVTELQEISGIGPKTFAKLEPHVRV